MKARGLLLSLLLVVVVVVVVVVITIISIIIISIMLEVCREGQGFVVFISDYYY